MRSTTSAERHRVLHIGGNAADAKVIQQALPESMIAVYDVEWVATLSEAVERLTTNRISAVLLHLELPDCRGIDGLQKLLCVAPTVPILVIGTDENDDAMISMGKSLKHRVIAEGVETREQRDFLRAEGCEEAQGYYFSHPLAAQQFAQLLESGSTPVRNPVTCSNPLRRLGTWR